MSLTRGFLLFLAGLALGVALAATGPRVAGPYLPEILQDQGEVVEGEVTRKLREPERLLLTVVTPRGAILATFTHKVPEIDLLVAEGDEVALGLRRFEPFVDDPVIQSVRKKRPAEDGPRSIPAPGAGPRPSS